MTRINKIPNPKFFAMNKKLKFYLQLLLLQTHLLICNGIPAFDSTSFKGNEMEVMVKKSCTGNKGLCLWEAMRETDVEMEMEMDSEVNRRVLMVHKKYISYETLKKDAVPCTNPGASYYNCHPMEKANPYNRGCEMISKCRGR